MYSNLHHSLSSHTVSDYTNSHFLWLRCFFNFYTGFYYLLFVKIFFRTESYRIVVNASAGIMQDPLQLVCTKIIVIIMPKNAHKLNYNDMVIQHIGIISWDVDSHSTLTCSYLLHMDNNYHFTSL